MAIYELDGVAPQVHTQAWVAPSAQVMGQVSVGAGASIWFGTVVRGDTERITIGADSNIQDASVLHADAGQPLVIGERVTVGHQAMLHGCTVGDESLIGIGAIVLNGAKIGKNCLVGAGALVGMKTSLSLFIGGTVCWALYVPWLESQGLLPAGAGYRDSVGWTLWGGTACMVVASIVAFLKTLTGKQPNFKLPTLPPSSNATPQPKPFE